MAHPTEEIPFKIALIEAKIQELEKKHTISSTDISELNKKLDQIKFELSRDTNDIGDIDNRVSKIEDQIDSIRLEFPEIRLIKKVVLGLIALLLTSFVGLLWNLVAVNSNPDNNANSDINKLTEKILREYSNKGNRNDRTK